MQSRYLLAPIVFLGILQAQAPTFQSFPEEQSIEAVYGGNIPNHRGNGHACGIGSGQEDSHIKAMFVAPKSITSAQRNTPLTIRYDASAICRGQMYADQQGRPFGKGMGSVGTVRWQPGVIQNLPSIYGVVTLPGGFSEVTSYDVTLEVKAMCVEDKSPNAGTETCTASAVVPVTIVAADFRSTPKASPKK